jgi:hypothetical protein
MSAHHTIIGEARKACQTKMLTGFSFKSFDGIRQRPSRAAAAQFKPHPLCPFAFNA